jgi:AcrR family transcriptional regulator
MAKRNGETWQRIVEKARDLFAESGYNGTGVAGIAGAAGVTNAGLYHYVENKEALLYAVLDEAISNPLLALKEIAERDLAPEDALELALDNHLNFVLGSPAAVRVFLSERRFLTGVLAEKYAASINEYDAAFDRILGRCSAASSPAQRKLLRLAILGMINWIPEWYDPRGTMSTAAVREFMKSVAIGLVVRSEVPLRAK